MTDSEDFARHALRQSMRMNGDRMKGDAAVNQQNDDSMARLPRVQVDFKIPLWGIGGGAVVLVWALISMYFTLQDVSGKVTQLQVSVEASRNLNVQLASDQALLKYRVEKLEGGHAK